MNLDKLQKRNIIINDVNLGYFIDDYELSYDNNINNQF